MGCDIHIYVEYSKDGKHWHSLTDNAGIRNYIMFGILAGVRGKNERLFDPKGMPEGSLSYTTEDAYWLRVAPPDKPEYADWDGWTSSENAERWVNGEYSVAEYRDGVLNRVSGPDWHSHSWLTADEVSAALDRYRKVVGKYCEGEANSVPTEWAAILGAMRAIEANGDKARVVFWFDN